MPLRRDFLRTVGLGATALALPKRLSAESAAAAAPASRPHILLIHVDEHRMECLGAYGNRDVKTPHIDGLAADGVRYDLSFCAFPVCTPSRYSLVSGLLPQDHGGLSNGSTLAPEIETFPKILQVAGYRTKAIGKMHYRPTYLDVGFSEMELSEQAGAGRWDDDYHRDLMRQGLADRNDYEDQVNRKMAGPKYWETLGALPSNLPEAWHSTTWIGDRAVRTLEQWDAATPSLLMLGFIKPHHPFDPPARWAAKYDPAKLALTPGWTDTMLDRDLKRGRGFFRCDEMTEAQFRRVLAYYYAGISHIDEQVGRAVEVLRRRGLYENALIIYTSDHGDHMGYHHMILKGNYTYDSTAKVPLIIKWPGGRAAGTVSKRMVNNIDLAPTLCRAAGCRPGARMEGQDLAVDGPVHDLIYCGKAMVRTRTRKLMTGPGKRIVFIDLEKDPLEMTDVSADPAYAAEIRSMQAALEAYLARGAKRPYVDDSAPQIRQPNVPPDLGHRPAVQKYFETKVKELEAEVL